MNNESTPRLVILALDLGTTTGWALMATQIPPLMATSNSPT